MLGFLVCELVGQLCQRGLFAYNIGEYGVFKFGFDMRMVNFILVLLLLGCTYSFGDCVSLVRGYIALDVKSCGILNPESTFDTSMERFSFIRELPSRDRQKFLHSYRGMLVRGLVVKSLAVRSGLTKERGVLEGENTKFFVHPGTSDLSCRNVQGKRIKALLDEACCEGGGDPPCLLSSKFVLKDIKVIGKAGGKSSSQSKARKSKVYIKAEQMFARKKFGAAIRLYEQANTSNGLDIKGLYHLAYSYRKDDRCGQAIRPLRRIEEKARKKETWAFEAKDVRNANFLLARCYSRLNKPQLAIPLLEGYLLEPVKYRKELVESLNHRDFRWIHTTKEYRNFKRLVHEKLRGR